jgi:hypothetical protein
MSEQKGDEAAESVAAEAVQDGQPGDMVSV